MKRPKGSDYIDEGRPVNIHHGPQPDAGEHARVLGLFKEQLLIVFLKRLRAKGDDLRFPVSEVDNTGQDLLSFSVVDGVFHFELRKKS
jgi:hypothetical protein